MSLTLAMNASRSLSTSAMSVRLCDLFERKSLRFGKARLMRAANRKAKSGGGLEQLADAESRCVCQRVAPMGDLTQQ